MFIPLKPSNYSEKVTNDSPLKEKKSKEEILRGQHNKIKWLDECKKGMRFPIANLFALELYSRA